MKRMFAWLMAIVMLFGSTAFAQEPTEEISAAVEAEVAEVGEMDLFDPSVYSGEIVVIEEPAIEDAFVDEVEMPEVKLDAAQEAEPASVGKEIVLGVGEKHTVSAGNDTPVFTSSNKSVATVSSTGKITAKKVGTTEIRASSNDGLSWTSWNITVRKAPKKISLSKTKVKLGEWEQIQLIPSLTRGSASNKLTWTSSKSSVAVVDSNGWVMGKKPGTAKITVKAFNGKKATCTVTVLPEPWYVNITPARPELSVGLSTKLNLKLTGEKNKPSTGACTFSAEPADSVSFEGNVMTALKEGTVTIKATAYNDAPGTLTMDILPAPDKAVLEIEGMALTLGVGEKYTLKPTVANGSPVDWSFESSDASIAKVSSGGKITAKKTGTCEITVKPHLGEAAKVAVTVVKAPKSVKLSKKKVTLGVGEPYALTAKVSAGTASAIKWSSSKKSVVSVDQEGNLTVKKTGTAKITAKTFNGKKATCTVTVKPAPQVVTVKASKTVMSIGQTAKLSTKLKTKKGKSAAGAYAYTVSPADCATIEKGVLTAVKEGAITVTSTAYNEVTGQTTIEILPAPDAVVLPSTSIDVGATEKVTLKPAIANGSPADYTYESSNKSIATVSASGKITAKKKGTVQITVTPHLGTPAVVEVTVKAAPTKVTLSQKKATIGANETLSLAATLNAGAASNKISWKSSNVKVATVDQQGNVTPLKAGKTTITATSYNGKSASCVLTITQPNASESYAGIDLYPYMGVHVNTFKKKFSGLTKVPTTDGTTELMHDNYYVATDFGKSYIISINIFEASPYTICGVYVNMDVAKAKALLESKGWSHDRTTQYAYVFSNAEGETFTFGYEGSKVTRVYVSSN